MNVVDRIKEICKKKHIAISKLERECGFGNGYIAGIKSGMVPADRLLAISKYLNVGYGYLLTGEHSHNIDMEDEHLMTIIDCYNTASQKYKDVLYLVAVSMAEVKHLKLDELKMPKDWGKND